MPNSMTRKRSDTSWRAWVTTSVPWAGPQENPWLAPPLTELTRSIANTSRQTSKTFSLGAEALLIFQGVLQNSRSRVVPFSRPVFVAFCLRNSGKADSGGLDRAIDCRREDGVTTRSAN